jgi:hypothetical protein
VAGGKNCTAQLETFGLFGVGASAHELPAVNTPPVAEKPTVPVGLGEVLVVSATVAVQVSEAVATT